MNGRIYTIISLIPQNGAKYVAINLGYFTKKTKKKSKVLLIDLDFYNPTLGYHWTKDSVYNIDNLVPMKNDLSLDALLTNITKTDIGFDILKGTTVKDENYIPVDLVAKILTLAKEEYTDIFVVVPPNLNNANIIMTLLNTDKIILVIKNNYANNFKIVDFLKRLESFVDKELTIDIIINDKNYSHNLNISETISTAEANVNYIGILDYDKRTVDNINLTQKSLFKKGNSNSKIFKDICKKL